MEQPMNEKTRKAAAIVFLSQNYGEAMSDGLLDMWLNLLAEYTPEQVERGVAEVIKTYEYKTRPPYAVLREAIDKVCGIRRIDPDEAIRLEAEAEWNKLLANIERYGSYAEPELDPTTGFVLRGMGGWSSACQWEVSKIEWRHKEFVDKWIMSHGREAAMSLGASGIIDLASGPQHISESQANNSIKAIVIAQHAPAIP